MDAINDAKETLSSWDKCMDTDYCKWPVIAAIIIGALIALSLIWCLVRCCCCGVECCCGCLSCCNSCCPSPRGKNKSEEAGYGQGAPGGWGGGGPPPGHWGNGGWNGQLSQPQQYQSHAPPAYTGGGASAGAGTGAGAGAMAATAAYSSAPKTATFEEPSRKYNEDALPEMPSWQTAMSRRVEEEPAQEAVEMDKLEKSPEQQQQQYYENPSQNQSQSHLLGQQQQGQEYNPYGMAGGAAAGGAAGGAIAARTQSPYSPYATRSPPPRNAYNASPYAASPYQPSPASPAPNAFTPNPYTTRSPLQNTPTGATDRTYASPSPLTASTPTHHTGSSYAAAPNPYSYTPTPASSVSPLPPAGSPVPHAHARADTFGSAYSQGTGGYGGYGGYAPSPPPTYQTRDEGLFAERGGGNGGGYAAYNGGAGARDWRDV